MSHPDKPYRSEEISPSVGEVGADAGFEMFSRKFQVRDRSG